MGDLGRGHLVVRAFDLAWFFSPCLWTVGACFANGATTLPSLRACHSCFQKNMIALEVRRAPG